jgi:hypothetical protein
MKQLSEKIRLNLDMAIQNIRVAVNDLVEAHASLDECDKLELHEYASALYNLSKYCPTKKYSDFVSKLFAERQI